MAAAKEEMTKGAEKLQDSNTNRPSYFLNISITSKASNASHEQPLQEVKIKIPNHNRSLIRKLSNPKIILPKKVKTVISNVVSNLKSSASSGTISSVGNWSSNFNKEVYSKSSLALKKFKVIGKRVKAKSSVIKRMGKGNADDDDDDDDQGAENELCKKRILIGERCRPENVMLVLS